MTLNKRLKKQYLIFIVSFFVCTILITNITLRAIEKNLFTELEKLIITKQDIEFDETVYYATKHSYKINYKHSDQVDYNTMDEIIENSKPIKTKYQFSTIDSYTASEIHSLDRLTYANAAYVDSENRAIYIQFPNTGVVYEILVDEELMKTLMLFAVFIVTMISILFFLILTFSFSKVLKQVIEPINKISNNLVAIKNFEFTNITGVSYKRDIVELDNLVTSSNSLATFLNNYVEEKSTLTSAITHEIRAPLNTINSLIIAHQHAMEPYDDSEYFLAKLDEKVNELSEISKYILLVYEHTDIKKETINFSSILHAELAKQMPSFEVKKLDVQITESDPFYATSNTRIVMLIMSNLLKNIAIYAKEESQVKIFITDTSIVMINKKNNKQGLGTQKGLRFTSKQLKQDNLNLFYDDVYDEYIVEIYKEREHDE